MLTKLKSYYGFIALAVLFLGALLRFVVYFQNRSLIIDEANLARNIVEKDPSAFFQSLDYQQYCPPIFLLFSKLNIGLFGVNEYALKILPLAAGNLLLVLFGILVRRLIKEPLIQIYLFCLLSFSTLALRYSTELKQYSSDAAITLGLLFLAFQYKEKKWTLKIGALWALGGCLALWTSMPSIFVLAAIGCSFLYQAWNRDKKIPLMLVAVGVCWVACFGLYFLTILYQDSTSDALQDYHHNFFFNFLPTNFQELSLDFNLILGLMTSVADPTAVGLIFSLLLLGIGMVVLIKKDKFTALLLMLPILFALIASHLTLYSLIPRLSLFIIPLFMLLVGVGLEFVWQKKNQSIQLICCIAMFISVINKEGYRFFWTKMEFEDSKTVLAYLNKHRTPNALIFVQHDAVPAFTFYNNLHDQAYHMKPVYLAKWSETPAQIPSNLKGTDSPFWLFFAHTFPKEKEACLDAAQKMGKQTTAYESRVASTYAFGDHEKDF